MLSGYPAILAANKDLTLNVDRKLEMFRRITENEGFRIKWNLEKLAGKVNLHKKIAQLVADYQNRNWNEGSALLDPNAQYYALLAYQEQEKDSSKKLLSRKQFANILIHRSASALHGTPSRPNPLRMLTPEDSDFKKLLTQNLTMGNLTEAEKKKTQHYVGVPLLPEKLAAFFAEIEKLPKSEQVFFVVDETIDTDKLKNPSKIVDRLTQIGFAILGRPHGLTFKSGLTRVTTIITTVELVEALARVVFGAHVKGMNLVIGLSSIDDIEENGLKGNRDVALDFSPDVALSEKADSYFAPKKEFTDHDIYHYFIICAILEAHRLQFINLGKAAEAFLKQKYYWHELAVKKIALSLQGYSGFTDEFETSLRKYCEDDETKLIKLFIEHLKDMDRPNYQSLFDPYVTIPSVTPAELFLTSLTKSIDNFISVAPSLEAIVLRKSLSIETIQGFFNALCRSVLTHNSEIAKVALAKPAPDASHILLFTFDNKEMINYMLGKSWRSVYKQRELTMFATQPSATTTDSSLKPGNVKCSIVL